MWCFVTQCCNRVSCVCESTHAHYTCANTWIRTQSTYGWLKLTAAGKGGSTLSQERHKRGTPFKWCFVTIKIVPSGVIITQNGCLIACHFALACKWTHHTNTSRFHLHTYTKKPTKKCLRLLAVGSSRCHHTINAIERVSSGVHVGCVVLLWFSYELLVDFLLPALLFCLNKTNKRTLEEEKLTFASASKLIHECVQKIQHMHQIRHMSLNCDTRLRRKTIFVCTNNTHAQITHMHK